MKKKPTAQQHFLSCTLQNACMAIMVFTICLGSCQSGTNKPSEQPAQIIADSLPAEIAQNDALDTMVQKTIAISANDFFKNQQPLPKNFRNVQIRYNIKPNKEVLYILCGQFATQDTAKEEEWAQFATIKNTAYEQWVGNSAITFCENSKPIPYTKMDLSIELKNKLNALQK
jgi:hypothetical protein